MEEAPTPCLLFPLSQDTHLPKNTMREEGRGAAGRGTRPAGRGEDKRRGIGGSRRGNERKKKREIASQLLPLSGCKLELIKILAAS